MSGSGVCRGASCGGKVPRGTARGLSEGPRLHRPHARCRRQPEGRERRSCGLARVGDARGPGDQRRRARDPRPERRAPARGPCRCPLRNRARRRRHHPGPWGRPHRAAGLPRHEGRGAPAQAPGVLRDVAEDGQARLRAAQVGQGQPDALHGELVQRPRRRPHRGPRRLRPRRHPDALGRGDADRQQRERRRAPGVPGLPVPHVHGHRRRHVRRLPGPVAGRAARAELHHLEVGPTGASSRRTPCRSPTSTATTCRCPTCCCATGTAGARCGSTTPTTPPTPTARPATGGRSPPRWKPVSPAT